MTKPVCLITGVGEATGASINDLREAPIAWPWSHAAFLGGGNHHSTLSARFHVHHLTGHMHRSTPQCQSEGRLLWRSSP